jgi:hypothetical protein
VPRSPPPSPETYVRERCLDNPKSHTLQTSLPAHSGPPRARSLSRFLHMTLRTLLCSHTRAREYYYYYGVGSQQIRVTHRCAGPATGCRS